MIAYLALIIALAGLLTFVLGRKNPELKEIGWVLMFCGFLVVISVLGGRTVKLF
jgi:hypothetical protein